MRAVVDTNVWVSALLNPHGEPARLLAELLNGSFTLLLSEPLAAELSEVLARPRIAHKYGITSADTREFIAVLRAHAEEVAVSGETRICRDSDDDKVIETAIRGTADVLVTRDDDLKGDSELVEALRVVGIAVLTVRRFLAALEAGVPPT